MKRREALSLILKGGFAAFIPGVSKLALASVTPRKGPLSGRLSLYNRHTHETLSLSYLDRNHHLDPHAIGELNQFFRCHYTGKVHPIEPDLFFLLDEIRTSLGKTNCRYRLISGYRSPEYNRKLRKISSGVAKKSYHLLGMAADIQLEDVRTETLCKAALARKKGGVGRYSKFIHVDVGPVRSW